MSNNEEVDEGVKNIMHWVALGIAIALSIAGYITTLSVQGAKIVSNTDRIIKLEQADADLRHDVERIVEKTEGRLVYQIDKANNNIKEIDDKIDRLIENTKK